MLCCGTTGASDGVSNDNEVPFDTDIYENQIDTILTFIFPSVQQACKTRDGGGGKRSIRYILHSCNWRTGVLSAPRKCLARAVAGYMTTSQRYPPG